MCQYSKINSPLAHNGVWSLMRILMALLPFICLLISTVKFIFAVCRCYLRGAPSIDQYWQQGRCFAAFLSTWCRGHVGLQSEFPFTWVQQLIAIRWRPMTSLMTIDNCEWLLRVNVFFFAGNESNDRTLLVGTMSVRAEEIGIVVVVLALWIFVIVLFFNKWGKIRMLEPYQPQYKHPRTPSCPHVHNTRLSLQLATFSSAEREHLLYSGPSCIHKSTRVRQNSVFVGNPYARHSLAQVTPSRKVKSAEDINSMIFNAQPNAASTSRVTMQTTNVWERRRKGEGEGWWGDGRGL